MNNSSVKEQAVVKVTNVTFSYDKGKKQNLILDRTSITVPPGAIYALLGPSGCGKTTLLKIVTGRIPLIHNGEVKVFGHKPGSKLSYIPGPAVGYMPQETSLQGNLDTKETLYLFGRLNGMILSEIRIKVDQLSKILELSLKDKTINDLSGGQQRRVSLATALMHNPPLLILDEPTVGVDPLLRQTIWSYLVKLATTRKTTVIVTTHYIEEARGANVIGAMRMGRVLVEAKPSTLLSHFKESSLEKCFSKLCYMDTSNEEIKLIESNDKPLTDISPANGAASIEGPFDRRQSSAMYRLKRIPNAFTRTKFLAIRNIIMWKRQMAVLIFSAVIPFLVVILFCTMLGQEMNGVRIAVANDEKNSTGLAQKFVDHLDRNIVSVTPYDFEAGINSVKSGHNYVLLHLGENFTSCTKQKMIDGLDAENSTLVCSQISAHFDMSNRQIFLILFQSFMTSYQSFYRSLLQSLGKNPALANWLLELTHPVYGSISTTLAETVVPGMIVVISHYMAAAITVVKLVEEKRDGTMEKLWISGVTMIDVFFSHLSVEMIVVVVQNVLILIFTFSVFRLTMLGSIFTFGAITILQGAVGLSFGLMMSSLIDHDAGSLLITVGVMFSNLMMGGIIWPLRGMPVYMRYVAYFLPLTMPSEALKAIMSKGWGIEHLTVVLGFVSSFAWGLFFIGFTILKLHLKP